MKEGVNLRMQIMKFYKLVKFCTNNGDKYENKYLDKISFFISIVSSSINTWKQQY